MVFNKKSKKQTPPKNFYLLFKLRGYMWVCGGTCSLSLKGSKKYVD